MNALKFLANDASIMITQADKGGGVVIVDMDEYRSKMADLLKEKKTYTKKNPGFIEKASKQSNQETREVFKKTINENSRSTCLEKHRPLRECMAFPNSIKKTSR